MAGKKSAAPLALRRAKKPSTPSTNHHRFEPFSQRIARLKIDPVRRVRGQHVDTNDDSSSSYFRAALDEWTDRNLSEDFTEFAKHALPISDSLAQVLHHEEKIVDLLLGSIEKGHTVSLEPLLDLVAHFAHDLGLRFEKHFERAVSTVSRLAARHQDVEVVEWSFNCLAWLFKYLSRLLVPDLRSVYDLMAPLLGRERQKPFVARFAAEAMSFLLRKAASHSRKDERPLRLILGHILDDIRMAASPKSDLYEQAVIVLFAEAIRGSQDSLHSEGPLLFQALLSTAFKSSIEHEEPSASIAQIVQGILIAILQHTDSESFAPVLQIIIDAYRTLEIVSMQGAYKMLYYKLLLFIVATSHVQNVADWARVIEHLKTLLFDRSAPMDSVVELLKTFAVAHQNCPLNVAISEVKFLESLASDERWRPYFIGFCAFHGDLGRDRFKDMLLPHFKRFVVAHWQGHKKQLCLAIPRFSSAGWFGKSNIALPKPWQEEIVREFSRVATVKDPLERLYYQNGALELLRVARIENDMVERLQSILGSAAEDVFRKFPSGPLELRDVFLGGNAFLYLAAHGQERELATVQALVSAAQYFKTYHVFWQAFFAYLGPEPPTLAFDFGENGPVPALMDCFSCPDHSMRLLALQVIDRLETAKNNQPSELLQLAILIASTSPSVEAIRTITMHLRNLAKQYHELEPSSYLIKVIAHFCFGLLHVRLSPVWDAVCDSLKEMCRRKDGEEAVCEIAFKWLEQAGDHDLPEKGDHRLTQKTSSGQVLTPELNKIEDQAQASFTYFESPTEQLKAIFERIHKPTSFTTSFNRTQALKVLKAIPESAERKSRMLVPVLLNWALNGNGDGSNADEEGPDTVAAAMTGPRWSRKDQKAMLGLFAQFHNPRVLYKAAELYEALLSLLSHGDVDIQKSALQAILTWKDPIVSRYEEQLLKFLDDSMFKEQLTVFLDVGKGNDSLREDHRAAVLPIVFRLMYGRIINRGKGDQQSSRKTVFILLSRFKEDEIGQFLDILLGRLGRLQLVVDDTFQEQALRLQILDQRRQLGLLNMVHDLLNTLKSTASPFAARLVDPVMYCLIRAVRECGDMANGPDNDDRSRAGLARSIRQTSLRCLIQLFDTIPNFRWQPYLLTVFHDLITPRLQNLAQENAQAVSSLLKLFGVWAQHIETVSFLADFNLDLIPRLAECVSNPTTKEQVRRFVLNDVIGCTLDLAEDGGKSSEARRLMNDHASVLLQHVGLALKADSSRELLEDCVAVIVRLANIVPPSSSDMLSSLPFLLVQPAKKVPFSAKPDILRIILRAIPAVSLTNALFDEIYNAVCSSFAYFSDRESRLLLCDILHTLARKEPALNLTSIANLCGDLNSYVSNRIDEPDFDRRSAAFSLLNEQMHSRLDSKQWQPLIHHMLFFIKDVEELAIRASATQALKRFVDSAGHQWMEIRKTKGDGETPEESIANANDKDFLRMLEKVVIPSIERGVRDQPELVRTEYLSLVSYSVAQLPAWPPLAGMATLLEPDDEASFFNNVLHIQQHNRIKALKRLVEEVRAGHVASTNLAHLLLPLVERFVFDTEYRGAAGGELSGEAARTISVMFEGLDWNQFRSTMRRYIGDIKKKEDTQEVVLKLVDGAAIALSKCAQRKFDSGGDISKNDLDSGAMLAGGSHKQPRLQQTLPSRQGLSTYLIEYALPSLQSFLRDKDDEVVSRRAMVAVTTARLLSFLPPVEFQARLPAVLLDTCSILRSKEPVSRDAARKALATMCQIIGPSSMSFTLKALRSALQRGFHLHVLSYTVHSILTSVAPGFATGALDHCVADIVALVMDDVFGGTGQEKDEAEYLKDKASKKEVKQKTSFDTMQLLASITSLPYMIDLIRPVASLLVENITQKMLRDVDELLRRIGLGVLQNKAIKDRDVLVFCHELIMDANKFAAVSVTSSAIKVGSKYLVRKAQAAANQRLTPQARVGKVVRFGLELLRSVLRKEKDLATPANIAGFLPIIGDAVVDEQEDLKLAAFRLFTQIIDVRLPRIETDAPVYVAEAVKIIEDSEGTEREELPAAALKLIAAVLRVKQTIKVKDHIVALLLKQLKPDLQVKSQQGSAFTLLKAIIARKIVIPEVYKLMDGDDGVAAISIRDHDRTTRELARSVWYQFILRYPQTKGRFKKALAFLTANLSYEHAEGRQAVLEAFNLLLSGLPDDMMSEVRSAADWSLVAVMVNDEDQQCREMAAALVKTVIRKADEDWHKAFLNKLGWMLGGGHKLVLRQTALQCLSLYLEEKSLPHEFEGHLLDAMDGILNPENDTEDEQHWQLIFHALILLRVISEHRTELVISSLDTTHIWDFVRERLNYPHAWVKSEAARLSGMYLEDQAKSIQTTGSLERMRDFAVRHLRLLGKGMSKELATQIATNLSIIGACFAAAGDVQWTGGRIEIKTAKGEEVDYETEDEEPDTNKHDTQTALQYLLQRLSGIMRRQTTRGSQDAERPLTRADTVVPKRAALDVLAKLVDILPTTLLSDSAETIVQPLIHLTDAHDAATYDAAYNEAMQELTSSASELLIKLQKKLGTTDYVDALKNVKKEMKERREERRTKRKVEAVAEPEKAERLKRKKQESLKARRKEKNAVARGHRRGW